MLVVKNTKRKGTQCSIGTWASIRVVAYPFCSFVKIRQKVKKKKKKNNNKGRRKKNVRPNFFQHRALFSGLSKFYIMLASHVKTEKLFCNDFFFIFFIFSSDTLICCMFFFCVCVLFSCSCTSTRLFSPALRIRTHCCIFKLKWERLNIY